MKPSAEKNNKSAGKWQRFSGSRLSHPAVWLFWIAVWFLLSLLVHRELLLPGPLQVLQKLGSMMLTGAFWSSVALSLLRILGGILAALILGVLLAILTEYSSLAKALFSPLMLLVRSTPVVSFIILALIWLGRDILPLFISALMVLPVVWANVSAGIAGQDPQLLEMARVYRLPRGRVFRRITVPSVLPHFRTALRSALGLGWKAGIAAEVLTRRSADGAETGDREDDL